MIWRSVDGRHGLPSRNVLRAEIAPEHSSSVTVSTDSLCFRLDLSKVFMEDSSASMLLSRSSRLPTLLHLSWGIRQIRDLVHYVTEQSREWYLRRKSLQQLDVIHPLSWDRIFTLDAVTFAILTTGSFAPTSDLPFATVSTSDVMSSPWFGLRCQESISMGDETEEGHSSTARSKICR